MPGCFGAGGNSKFPVDCFDVACDRALGDSKLLRSIAVMESSGYQGERLLFSVGEFAIAFRCRSGSLEVLHDPSRDGVAS